MSSKSPSVQALWRGPADTLGVVQPLLGKMLCMTASQAGKMSTIRRNHGLTRVQVFGQLIGSGVLRAMVTRDDQWAYRIPFALQWIWPVPLICGIYFAPESPWWLVRMSRMEEARTALLRLVSVEQEGTYDVDKAVTLMAVTVAQERKLGTGTRYWDLFRGVDLRRTYVACACWMIQVLSGTGLRVYSTYFYIQYVGRQNQNRPYRERLTACRAGLPTEKAFDMTLAGYALGILGVLVAWALLPKVGRRRLYLFGLVSLCACLLAVGILGSVEQPSDVSIAWAIGSILLVYTFFYDITIGPVCYSLVSEIPSVRLKSKTIVLARASYNVAGIVSNVITPYMLNPSAWNWGAKAGFFWAGACMLSLVFTFFCIPEPKDRTYAELNILFQRRVSARRFADTAVNLYDTEEGDYRESD
jgi:MFS transporter, SP family, general alpha glucoside:H+ symporter